MNAILLRAIGFKRLSFDSALEVLGTAIFAIFRPPESGSGWPYGKRITINLAPADVRKEGPSFDLPIALGMLKLERKQSVAGPRCLLRQR
jgi:Subunit ChlI of Mg-chelatase